MTIMDSSQTFIDVWKSMTKWWSAQISSLVHQTQKKSENADFQDLKNSEKLK